MKKKDILGSQTDIAAAASDRQSIFAAILGYACKLIVFAVSVWGIMTLICSTAGVEFDAVRYIPAFLICTLLGSVSALFLYGKTRALIAWIGVMLVLVLGFLMLGGGVNTAVVTPSLVFYDQLLWNLSENGFDAMADYIYDGQYYGEAGTVYEWGMERAQGLICIIISFFTAFSLSFHTVLPFYYGMSGVLLVAVCCYNVFDSDAGFMAVVSCLIAATVMGSCNRRFKHVLDIPFSTFKKNFIYYSKSGACGLLALLMCTSLWLIPAKMFTEPWEKIPEINNTMDKIRDVTVAWFSGENGDDFKIDTSGNGTAIDFGEKNQDDKVLGRVYTLSPEPLYLRVVTYENYDEGKWKDDEDLRITPETLTEFFMDVMGIMPDTEAKMSDRGEAVEASGVGVELDYNGYIRLPVPYMYSPDQGLCDFGRNTPYSLSNWYVHNGDVFSGTTLTKDMKYSTVQYRFSVDSDSAENSDILMRKFSQAKKYFEKWLYGELNIEQCRYEYELTLARNGIDATPDNCILYRDEELKRIKEDPRLIGQYFDMLSKYEKYDDYIYDSYTDVSSTPLVKHIAEEMKPDSKDYWIGDEYIWDSNPPELWSSSTYPEDVVYGYYAPRRAYTPRDIQYVNHVLSNVRKYFDENCTYTTEPKVSGEYKEPVNEFLLGEKEGYCVHYATSAVVLLRYCGIPARYAEGYLVSDLKRSDGEYEYSADIKERSAHAWVEYYLPGFGWQIFEATSVFARANEFETLDPDKKPPIAETTAPVTTSPYDTEEETTAYTDTETVFSDTTAEHTGQISAESESADMTTYDPLSPPVSNKDHTVRNVVLAVICVTVIGGVAFLVLMHRQKELEKKKAELDAALSGKADDDFVQRYTRRTLELLRTVGYAPHDSELSRDFAKRCGETAGYTEDVVYVYQKYAFYGRIEKEDVIKLASAYREIEKYILANAKKRRLLILRIKGRI